MHETSVNALSGFAADGGVPVKIRGSCMAPLIEDGATVVVTYRRTYLPGDVIVFRTPAGDLAAHRLLGWRPAGFVTRGDHCSTHDAPVPRKAIVGAVDINIRFGSRIRAIAGFARIIVRRLAR